MLLICYRLCMC